MKFNESAPPYPAMTRPVWMSQEGGPLYDEWTNEMLRGAENSTVWDKHLRLTEKINPGIVDGLALDPHNIVRTLNRKDGSGLLQDIDEQTGASERLLVPRQDEILYYTSARSFIKEDENVSKSEAVTVHARDSLRFAVAIPIGLVDDVFTVRTQEARHLLNDLMRNNMTDEPPDTLATAEAVREILGPLWDSSLEEPSMEHNPDILERVFALQRLTFIAKSLGNQSLHDLLEEFSVTAFDQLGDPCIVLNTRWLEPSEGGIKRPIHGWQYRAHHFGMLSSSHPSRPKSVLTHDMESDTFSTPPKIIQHLHDVLRRQNQDGLRESAHKSAGNIQRLKTPLSVGCPVHNRGSIPSAARLGINILEGMINYHQEHPIA